MSRTAVAADDTRPSGLLTKLARLGGCGGLTGDVFPRFRTAFERRAMVRLVGFAEDELVKRLADTAGQARDETIKFITNPEIFSMICGEIAAGAYEFLFSEGFLDLPPEWIHAEQG